MALCTITGFVYMPNGQPAADRLFKFKTSRKGIAAGYFGAIVPEVIEATTDELGFLTVQLLTGDYVAFSALYNGPVTVPDADEASLYEVFGGTGSVTPPEIAPNFTTLPSLLGSTSLGGTITVNLGAASGSPEPVITGTLTRPGASPVAVTQGQLITVQSGDQGGSLSLTATATNSAGVDTETVSRAIPAAIPAPVFTTPLADVVMTVGDVDVVVNLDESTDNATVYSVSPTGGAVTISGSSMAVSASAEVDQLYAVTATGPGGAATDTFGVLVAPASELDPLRDASVQALKVGFALPPDYAATNADYPAPLLAKHLDAGVLEAWHKQGAVMSVDAVTGARTYSLSRANADVAAAPMPITDYHSVLFHRSEPSNFAVSANSADANYWRTVMQEYTNYLLSSTSNFQGFDGVEIITEPILQTGFRTTYADSTTGPLVKWYEAADIDSTWADPELYLKPAFDLISASGYTGKYIVSDYSLTSGWTTGEGSVGYLPAGSAVAVRKRGYYIPWLHKVLNACRGPWVMKMQAHLDSSYGLYPRQLEYWLREMNSLLVPVQLGELNIIADNIDTMYPGLTDAEKREFAARYAAWVVNFVGSRSNLSAVIGWTDFPTGTPTRTPLAFFDAGAETELAYAVHAALANLPATPALGFGGQTIFAVSPFSNQSPYVTGVTSGDFSGVWGNTGAMRLDYTGRYKRRAGTTGPLSVMLSNNATQILRFRTESGVGRVYARGIGTDGTSVIWTLKNSDTISNALQLVTQEGTLDLGSIPSQRYCAVGIDSYSFSSAYSIKAIVNVWDAGARGNGSPQVINGIANTIVGSVEFPQSGGTVKYVSHEVLHSSSRLSSDALMISGVDPTPETYLTKSQIDAWYEALPLS